MVALLTGVVWAVPPEGQPTTAPYEIDDGSQPLLPTGVSDYDVELFGKFAYTWKQDGISTVLYRGNFDLRMGRRRLRSDEAVVWLTRHEFRGQGFTRLDVFLWQKAEVREAAGTVSTGPVFLVTVQTFGEVKLNADATTIEPQTDVPLYKNAMDTRRLVEAKEAVEADLVVANEPNVPKGSAQAAAARPKPANMRELFDATVAESKAKKAQPKKDSEQKEKSLAQLAGKKGTRPGEEMSPMMVKAVPDGLGLPGLPKGAKRVTYRGRELQIDVKKGIVVAMGDVYITQAGEGPADLLEIKADAAVLFLAEGATGQGFESLMGDETSSKKKKGGGQQIKLEEAGRDDGAMGGPKSPMQTISEMVKGAYLEGDVTLSRGDRMIRSPQLYYDFENTRALILDAVMRIVQPDRGVPIYVRADTVRQLSSTEYMATHARVTSSEFYTPHYHIGAEKVYLRDATSRDATGQIVGLTAGSYEMYNSTFNIGGVPVSYWPYTKGDFKQGEMQIRSVKAGYSSDFGATFETKWYLFNLLGIEPPKGYDAWLNLDYFSKHGPGVGINIDYERDKYYGLFRSYFIYDTGEDDLGPYYPDNPETETRGRLTWRHRQYLPKDWELTFEASYITDPTFLQMYEEDEYFEGKDQETLIYLKKQKDNWAFTALAQWRILDFLTQTEHLPDFGFNLIGQDVGSVATLFSESHAGVVRYLPDDRRVFNNKRYADNTEESDFTPRLNERAEINLPLALGPVKVVPFSTGRADYWSSTPTISDVDGAAWRGFIDYGLRGSTYLARAYPDVSSRLLDINGIKHIVKPDVGAWMAHSNLTSQDLYPFDQGIESVDAFGGATAGLRQRWQTKRGGPGQWRTVDLLTLDLEYGYFGSGARKDQTTHGEYFMSRPEDSITSDYLSADLNYRLSDTTAFLWDFTYDIEENRVGKTDVSIAVERLPRVSYFFGWRYIGQTESNLLGGGANYKLNEKHTIAARAYYDLEEGQMAEWTITLLRKLPRWYVAITGGYDAIDDEWSLTLAAWPEGLPEATLGSRRFTGLANTTGIYPQRSRGGLAPATPTPPVDTE